MSGSYSGGGGLSAIAAYSVLANGTNASAVPVANTSLTVGTPGFTAAAGTVAAQFTGASVGSYYQYSIQNTDSTSGASSDFICTCDTGNDSTDYADFGINNSGGGGAPFTTAKAAYLYTTTNELDIGALGTTGVINFYCTGGTSTPVRTYQSSINKFTIGNADAAVAVAQTLSVQNVVAGTTNAAGANFTIKLSQGTGTGAGGGLIVQYAAAGLTGSSVNALATVLTISNVLTVIVNASFSQFVTAGALISNTTLSTADSTSGAGPNWKLGSLKTATVALDTTKYVEVNIGGTIYKLLTAV